MPGMSDSGLAERIRKRKPDLAILFISGYTLEVITSQEKLEEGITFLQKPFSARDLGEKIREAMGQKEEKPRPSCASSFSI